MVAKPSAKARAAARAGMIRVRLIRPGGTEVEKLVKPPSEGRVLTLDKNAGYVLDQKRFTHAKGMPTITFVSGKAEAVDPYGQESSMTSEEVDEVARNAYVSDVRKGLSTTGLKESLPWLTLGAIGVLALLTVWLTSSLGDDLDAILQALQNGGYGGGSPSGSPSANGGSG